MSPATDQPPAAPDRPGRRLAFLALALGAGLLVILGLAALARRQQAPAPAEAAYRILEQSRSPAEIRLVVEMEPNALKTEIEQTARLLLHDAPATAARRIDFWLGPKGPFNPVYASVMLDPGQPNEPFRLFLHRH